MIKEKFDIQGMTCSSCSSHVDKAVRKLQGIHNVNVNLLSNNMIVEYDEKVLKNEDIIKAVEEAGYGIGLSGSEKGKEETKKIDNKSDIQSMKKRLVISIIFLIPLIYVSMHQMLEKWLGIPIPQFIKAVFDGNKNAITYGFTQLLLLIPIVYANRNYFIIGFKRLLKRTPNMDSLIALSASASIAYGIYAIYMLSYGLGNNKMNIVEKYSMDMYFESAGMILTLITLRKIFRNEIKGKDWRSN